MAEDFFKDSTDHALVVEVMHSDGSTLVCRRSGISRANPENMYYTLSLGAVAPVQYKVWLTWPSADPKVNRRAFSLGLYNLINKVGAATISHTVDVSTLPEEA